MRKVVLVCWVYVLFGALLFAGGKPGESEDAVLEELLAIESATLDPYYHDADPTAYAELFADKATYFDPWSGGRLEGAAIKEHLMAFKGRIPKTDYEIPNPRVDLYGDTAIFTFNLDAKDQKTGAITGWDVTLVFLRSTDGWKRVHANWAFKE